MEGFLKSIRFPHPKEVITNQQLNNRHRKRCAEQLENTRVQLENAKAEVQKPFPQEEELAAKTARLNELNALLNLDKSENEIVDGERGEEELSRSSDDRER